MPRRPRAADMTETLTLQSETTVADAIGGRSKTWATLAIVRGEVLPLSGAERLQAGSVDSAVRYRLRIYRRSDVTPELRVAWTPSYDSDAAASAFEILSVLADRAYPRVYQVLDVGDAV